MVSCAVNQNAYSYAYASPRIKCDKEFAIKCIRENPWVIEYVPEKFKNNKKIMMEAISRNGQTLQFASERLRNDVNVVLTAISKSETAIMYASKRIIDICGNDNQYLNLSSWVKYGKLKNDIPSKEKLNVKIKNKI